MAPSTRAARRANASLNPPPRNATVYDAEDSSSDESIPNTRPSLRPDIVATLRAGNKAAASRSLRNTAPKGNAPRISSKRRPGSYDDDVAAAERRPAKIRRVQPPRGIVPSVEHDNGEDNSDDVARDADVNHAALDAINAFGSRQRGPKRPIEVHIPLYRKDAAPESEWNPEMQLQVETDAYDEILARASSSSRRASAHPSVEAPWLPITDGDVDSGEDRDTGAEAGLVVEHEEQEDDYAALGIRQEVRVVRDIGSPELDTYSTHQSMVPAHSRPRRPPSAEVRESEERGHAHAEVPGGEEMDYAPTNGYENTTASPVTRRKAPRKSKKRVVKPAYNERAAPEEHNKNIAISVSRAPAAPTARKRAPRTQKAAPRTAPRQPPDQQSPETPRKARNNGVVPSSGRSRTSKPSKSRVRAPKQPRSPVPQPEVIRAEPDDNDQAPDNERLDEIPFDDVDDSVSGPQPTVTLKSNALRSMRRLLGGSGWTAMGRDWIFELSDPGAHGKSSSQNAPPRTKLGRGCWKFVIYLRSLLADAPKAPDFAAQTRWLSERRTRIDKTFRSIDTMVRKISEDYLGVVGDSGHPANKNTEMRVAMVRDLLDYVIPILVAAMHTVFFLGGVEYEADGRPTALSEGEFTIATLDCLTEVVGWVSTLERALLEELKNRPLDASSDEDTSDGEGGRYKKPRDGRERAKAQRKERRLRLEWFIWEFRRHVREAYKKLEEAVTKEERRQRAAVRENELMEARLREQVAEEEAKVRRWQAMCQSTHQMARSPSLLRERWRREESLRSTPPSGTASSKHLGPSSTTNGGNWQATSSQHPQSSRPERPRPGWPAWEAEESRRVLAWLRASGLRPDLTALAEELGRDVQDVEREAEELRRAWRSLAWERGMEVEEWAKGPVEVL